MDKLIFSVLCSIVMFALPLTSQSTENAKAAQKPGLTTKQRALLQEMGQDAQLNSNIASFIGVPPQRVLQQSDETQTCFAAQYIVFQDLVRSNLAPQALTFAQTALKREDWCAQAVKTTANKTVNEVLSYDGINSLFFVLHKDIEARLVAANLAAAGSAIKAR